ncbi:TSUP family transporter [Microbacterium sp. LWH3-1.2]|uniref:TSUP family transporter n=1 Tax=Microbacterium sp. LWH3-1.2 TaxID=3135256 RepID=UPI003425446A
MPVLPLGSDQRRAAGASMAVIVLTAPVRVVEYALNGSVNRVADLILAAGAIVGAQIGTCLLSKVSNTRLR